MRAFSSVAAVLLFFSAHPASAQLVRSINFTEVSGPTTLSWRGTEVTVQPRAGEGELVQMSAAIRVPGFQSIIVDDDVEASAGHERVVAIGMLSGSDPAPSVLLEGFTGGAHCCATLKAIVPYAGRLRVLEFDPIDGGPTGEFPKDIDGDGTADFVRQDDRFRYAFSSGAGSFSPPMILNIYKGQIVDVSGEPSFRPLWEEFAKITRSRCADRQDDDRNGACIAYLAAAARLGRYERAFAETEKMASQGPSATLPTGCSVVERIVGCPPEKRLNFYTFGAAARWFLQRTGYIQ